MFSRLRDLQDFLANEFGAFGIVDVTNPNGRMFDVVGRRNGFLGDID
jgi:hypothetical protein